MAQQYLLPCECGKANPVTVAQAGRTLTCECGREHKVPTLAALRQLEPVASLSKEKPAASWNSTRGTLFVVGLLLAIAGLGVGGWGSYVLRYIDVKAVQHYEEHMESMDLTYIDNMTLTQTYDDWKSIQLDGPGAIGSAFNVQAQQAHDYYLRLAIIGFGVAAAGIALAASSLVRIGSPRQAS